MHLGRQIKSDVYKWFHTPIWLIHLGIPLLGLGLFLGYYSFSEGDEISKLSGYIQSVSIVFPVLIGIIMAVLTEIEQRAGGFYSMLVTPNEKYIPHISQLLLIMMFGFIASVLALVGFGIGFIGMGYTEMTLTFYVMEGVFLFISVIPLYLLHYIVSFCLGKEFGIGLGIVGGLMSALLLTGLGDRIWVYIPWGIAARFPESVLLYKVSKTNGLQYDTMIKSYLYIAMFTLLFATLFGVIFNKWEGRKSED